jgi:uncharacterized protein YndB with AHSA1/START domain
VTVESELAVPAAQVYDAWTTGLGTWFAAPASVLMRAEVNAPFFFETEQRFPGESTVHRHPHYGRFLQLVPASQLKFTWVTGAGGTDGAETVVSIHLTDDGTGGCQLRLTHAGFSSDAARERHAQAWPMVLEQLENALG